MASLGALLYVDVRDNGETRFAKIGARPARFCLADQTKTLPQVAAGSQPPISKKPRAGYAERDLHPFLVYVAYAQLGGYCKTIFHEKAKKSGFNQWLYPDLVGIVLTARDWHKEVVEFGRQLAQATAKVISFEMKISLDFSNLREAFFQTVSNSSWAHEGYLVASEIDEDPEFRSELRRLSDSFGIGVIRLDTRDPDSSEIVFQARHRPELDWETVNKIAEQSPDFQLFLQAARHAVMVNKSNPSDFDAIAEDAAMLVAALAKKAAS